MPEQWLRLKDTFWGDYTQWEFAESCFFLNNGLTWRLLPYQISAFPQVNMEGRHQLRIKEIRCRKSYQGKYERWRNSRFQRRFSTARKLFKASV